MKAITVEQAVIGDEVVFIASANLAFPISAKGKSRKLAKSNLYGLLDTLQGQIKELLNDKKGN